MEQSSAFDHYARGRVLKQSRMFKEAIEQFQRATADPRCAGNAHAQIALCLRLTGQGEAAVTAFRQALESATFSSKERAHILYLQGQTLETLGRHAEALEAYGWSRNEDPDIPEATRRIKYLISNGRSSARRNRSTHNSLVGDLQRLRQQLTPYALHLVARTWKRFRWYVDKLRIIQLGRTLPHGLRGPAHRGRQRDVTLVRCSTPASQDHRKEKRRHVRVAVRLHGHFSSKNRLVSGEGVLHDLSPGGCRVSSSVTVLVGTEVECCIVPQDAVNPFTIEGATVRWSRSQEFGLAFTKMRPDVQRQIAQLCGIRTALGIEIPGRAQRSA